MSFGEIIRAKRDGRAHTREELERVARAAAGQEVPDYQLTAWLMAAYIQGLTQREAADLTLAMAASGERLDLSSLPKPWLDKHSTGGVGDKTTIAALPLLASCGLTLVKMSGRGLGVTGGTIDKLESIPGFRIDLAPEELIRQAGEIGLALTGQTPRLAPADKRLYGLRDVTETVDSIPLIASSILSKKIAGGAETVLLDVKCGSGAFMRTLDRANELAHALEAIGSKAGLHVRSHVTDMDQPLGWAAGAAIEVVEAFETLAGGGSPRFRELLLELCSDALVEVGHSRSKADARTELETRISSGEALAAAERWVRAQGGNPDVVRRPNSLLEPVVESALVYEGLPAWVARWDALAVGQAVLELGGGRKLASDRVDVQVGVVSHVEVGQRVEPGERIATVRARSVSQAEATVRRLRDALETSERPTPPRPVVITSSS